MRAPMRTLLAISLAVCAASGDSDGGTDPKVRRGPDQVSGSDSDA